MNYRHIFHAGSFADVFKHSVLMQLLQSMTIKEKGFCYIDTHAGRGLYDLTSLEAQRSPEHRAGIVKLLQRNDLIAPLRVYQQLILSLQQNNEEIVCYPGSPWIAATQSRSQDQLILNEKHPVDFSALKTIMHKAAPSAHCHQRDAYEFLPAMLPPPLRRALIFIDPAYEKDNEWKNILAALQKCKQRFGQGMYAVWYPIVAQQHLHFIRQIPLLKWCPVLSCEMTIAAPNQPGLRGCGMLIFNPPWQQEIVLQGIVKYLHDVFCLDENTSYKVELRQER